MGTHISKVKSVDLDVWTPEQMESVQKWGNRLANLYWEAHLKSGHIPPDHKIESFIRSKYEAKRWALEGPLPSDPSVLASGVASTASASSSPPPPPPIQQTRVDAPSRASHAQSSSISAIRTAAPTTSRHQLLSAGLVNRPPGVTPALQSQPQATQIAASSAAPAPAPAPQNDLFSLDFHAPPVRINTDNNTSNNASSEPKKDVKQDILSLFSPPSASVPAPAAASPLAAAHAPVTSMMGSNGTGMWGASSGWNAAPASASAVQNVWGNQSTTGYQQHPQQTQGQPTNLFASSNDIWGNSSSTTMMGGAGGPGQDPFGSFSMTASGSASATSAAAQQKKQDDAFGDIWGGFK
ncbi:hypothetical protein D9757_007333 [Collybiopsis confluens]|uniref:Arf-GAP domain-containing protein n=1 Tax=Collybiopsis confluens TaxID=2823264 RepID=A0A8H5HGH7_9AGAR|nr:hypothetical protein D9757_007333 [Collybiopsis confluens]